MKFLLVDKIYFYDYLPRISVLTDLNLGLLSDEHLELICRQLKIYGGLMFLDTEIL